MSADFKVQVKSGTVSAALELIQKAKLPEMLEKVGEVVVRQSRDRIDFERKSPAGVPWKKWSRAYARSPGAKRMLYRSGEMYKQIRADVRDKKLFVTSDVPYAAVHQKGSRKKNIPARPFLGISKKNEAEVLDTVARWMGGLLK